MTPHKSSRLAALNSERIAERFVGSGLSKVAGELLVVSEQAAALNRWLGCPQLALRALAGLGIALKILPPALAASSLARVGLSAKPGATRHGVGLGDSRTGRHASG